MLLVAKPLIFIKKFIIFSKNNQVQTCKILLNLDDIKGVSALAMLDGYNGINPYILKMKLDYSKNRKLVLTENQAKYILDNFKKSD